MNRHRKSKSLRPIWIFWIDNRNFDLRLSIGSRLENVDMRRAPRIRRHCQRVGRLPGGLANEELQMPQLNGGTPDQGLFARSGFGSVQKSKWMPT